MLGLGLAVILLNSALMCNFRRLGTPPGPSSLGITALFVSMFRGQKLIPI